MLSKQTNTRLKTCSSNITKQQSRIKEAEDRVKSGTSWDVIGINSTLNAVKEKTEAEAKMYYKALDAHLESVVENMPSHEVSILETGISNLKKTVNERILDTERSALDLRLIMQKHEEEMRAKQEQKFPDNMSRRAGAVKKHFKPTEALMPEKLAQDVK